MTGELFPVARADVKAASAEFKLSITRALADQLAEALDQLRPVPLTAENLNRLEARPGVYELFLEGERVYVGKASKDLPFRLGNHLRKLSGRARIDLAGVSFLCLYVDEDWEAVAPETLLIKKYRRDGVVPWNTNGFGNNDPGRNRDSSVVKDDHFDAIYPIDLDKEIDAIEAGTYDLPTYLAALKSNLPYVLRFDSDAKRLATTSLHVPTGIHTARQLIGLAVSALPEGWQATALPGYVILYAKESDYRSALMLWRKENGVVREIVGERHTAAGGGFDDAAVESPDQEDLV